MKIAGKVILALLLISSTLLSTNCYADFVAKGCVDSDDWIGRYDLKAWDDRCQDLHMQKAFGNRAKALKDFYFKLKKLVAANDKKAIAKLLIYPMGLRYSMLSSESQFLARYDGFFNENIKEMIMEHEYRDLYIYENSVVMLACRYADPLGPCSITFTIDCEDDNADENKKTCPHYSIKIVGFN